MIKIKNYRPSETKQSLLDRFNKYGHISNCTYNQRFSTITFEDKRDAIDAIAFESTNGMNLQLLSENRGIKRSSQDSLPSAKKPRFSTSPTRRRSRSPATSRRYTTRSHITRRSQVRGRSPIRDYQSSGNTRVHYMSRSPSPTRRPSYDGRSPKRRSRSPIRRSRSPIRRSRSPIRSLRPWGRGGYSGYDNRSSYSSSSEEDGIVLTGFVNGIGKEHVKQAVVQVLGDEAEALVEVVNIDDEDVLIKVSDTALMSKFINTKYFMYFGNRVVIKASPMTGNRNNNKLVHTCYNSGVVPIVDLSRKIKKFKLSCNDIEDIHIGSISLNVNFTVKDRNSMKRFSEELSNICK
eukprot:TRINITY_DN1564_c0_g1_i2.p1 TRINITY_DN1564_c0_g1~~TRINITY_DN1564_c0_g1_i2.p1  ORF type:complete len:349 (-),score=41.48 TRINITY_DN1564_c0_g1_i2:65-1111(-)